MTRKELQYTVYVPIGYELIEEQGFDSYVGRIENKNITFRFDYGWHSDNGPMSKKALKNRIIINDFHLETAMNSCDFGTKNKRKIKKHLQVDTVYYNAKYLEESDKEVIIGLSMGNTYCEYKTSPIQSKMVEEISQYLFIEKGNRNKVTKIFYPKPSFGNYAGIYIENLNDQNRLSYFTRDYSEKNHKEILEILLEVENNYE